MDVSKSTVAVKRNCGSPRTLSNNIVYNRQFLLKCRESDLSKAAPSDLPEIPGVTIGIATSRNPHQRSTGEEGRRLTSRDSHPDVFKFDDRGLSPTPPKMPMRVWEDAIGVGPLAQYRRRQSTESLVAEGGPMRPEHFFHPPIHHLHQHLMNMGTASHAPIPPNSPFIPPPVLMAHPLQGPSGLISEQSCITSQMSKLNIWRKSHARNEIPDVQGYTTAKTPQLRPSFPPHPSFPGGNRRYSVPEFGTSPIPTPSGMTLLNPAQLLADAGYHTHHPINIGVPDDPSIIAYKPSRKMAGDSSHMLSPMSISF